MGREASFRVRWQVTDRSCSIRDCRDDMGVNRGEGYEDMWSRDLATTLSLG